MSTWLGKTEGRLMKTLILPLAIATALIATAPAYAFSVYTLQSDGNTARYMAPGASEGTGLQLNDDSSADSDNGLSIYHDSTSSFSLNGSVNSDNGARPNSLNYNSNTSQTDPNAPFTGYYMRNR